MKNTGRTTIGMRFKNNFTTWRELDLKKLSCVTGMGCLSDPLLIVFSKCDSIERNVIQFKLRWLTTAAVPAP